MAFGGVKYDHHLGHSTETEWAARYTFAEEDGQLKFKKVHIVVVGHRTRCVSKYMQETKSGDCRTLLHTSDRGPDPRCRLRQYNVNSTKASVSSISFPMQTFAALPYPIKRLSSLKWLDVSEFVDVVLLHPKYSQRAEVGRKFGV